MSNAISYCPLCRAENADPAVEFCKTDGTPLRPVADRSAAWVGRIVADRYRILRPLGSGGMAEVYEAEQISSGRHLAFKVMLAELAREPEALARFHNEARMVSLIAHPNVVQLVDFGVSGEGMPFMVMELLEGRRLTEAMAGGAMTPEDSFKVILQACEGLAAAHERGVIHRDLKPDNLFLQASSDGGDPTVKILDLGIGKLLAGPPKANVTRAGSVFGTPDYMSPEQCRGEKVGPATDIYSLGAVLYEMLIGSPPFEDLSPVSVLVRQVNEDFAWPTELAAARGVPAEAQAVIRRAMAKHPEERQESMIELQRDVAGLLTRVRRAGSSMLPPRSPANPPGAPGAAGPTAPTARSLPPPATQNLRRVSLSSAIGADHEVVEIAADTYWVSRRDGRLLECNTYLRVFGDGEDRIGMLVDPGPPKNLRAVMDKVKFVLGSLDALQYLFINHQDPDVAFNATAIQHDRPDVQVLCSTDTWRLCNFYGLDADRFVATDSFEDGQMRLPTGQSIQFVPSPFCHFRGATMAFDRETAVLFSGDLFGGTSDGPGLLASEESLAGVDFFHQLYMPTNRALARAVAQVRCLFPKPAVIAPQHGAVVTGRNVDRVLLHVERLKVGLDLIETADRAPHLLTAANEMVAAFARIAGRDQADEMVRRYASDGSFGNLFVLGPGGQIAEFRVDPRLALDALFRDAVEAAPQGAEQEVKRTLLAVREKHR
jgi:serine/threonine protein kinase/glyoxylase-like metal-dependent hydrolase (beta-lactamase superfamily II)